MEGRIKVVVVGDPGCGKSSLLYVFTSNQKLLKLDLKMNYFIKGDYSTTFDGRFTDLLLYNTSDREDFTNLRRLVYPKTDVVLLCFSIEDPYSLKNINLKWLPEVKEFCLKAPVVLVGNKVDLRNDFRPNCSVDKEVGLKMAEEIGAFDYMECSALENNGVREVFLAAVRAFRNLKSRH